VTIHHLIDKHGQVFLHIHFGVARIQSSLLIHNQPQGGAHRGFGGNFNYDSDIAISKVHKSTDWIYSNQLQKNRQNVRVEMLISVHQHQFISFMRQQRLSVWPVRSYGVIDISDGYNPGIFMNIIPAQSTGIAAAIILFMMLQRNMNRW